jgi:hypothetical protein
LLDHIVFFSLHPSSCILLWKLKNKQLFEFKWKCMWNIHEWSKNGRITFVRKNWKECKFANINPKMQKKHWKYVFKNCMFKGKYENCIVGMNQLCSIFSFVNDNKYVDTLCTNHMLIFYCNSPIIVPNPKN